MLTKKISIFLLLIGLSIPGFAQEAKIPKAGRDWVNDYANVLQPQERNLISALITELERQTSAEIAVVTINSIGITPIEEYAVDLFEKWGIGKKGKDNGLLILVALSQRQMKIEVGYGLEGVITDGTAGQIIREKMVPQFREGRFGAGILLAVATTANLIAEDSGVQLRELNALPQEQYQIEVKSALAHLIGRIMYLAFIFMIFGGRFFIFPLFFPFFGRGRYWSGGRGGFGGGGGFGGFGGGMSGGGGAMGRW